MNIHLFLISFSYLYAKYKYNCYEVPKNMPIRYFDGNIWRIMKQPRGNHTIGYKRPNISMNFDFDWDLFMTTENQNNHITKQTTKRKAVKLKKQITKKALRKSTVKAIKATSLKPNKTIKVVKKKPTTKITSKAIVVKTTKFMHNKSQTTTKNINIARTFKSAVTKTVKKNITKLARKIKVKKKSLPKNTTTKVQITKKHIVLTTKKAKLALRTTSKKPVAKSTRKAAITTTTALPANWISVLKDLVQTLKKVEKTCNNTVCNKEKPETHPNNMIGGGRRAMSHNMSNTPLEDVLLLLLNGGIEIDKPESPENELLYDFRDKANEEETYQDFANLIGAIPLPLPKNIDFTDQNHNLRNVRKESEPKTYLEALPRHTKSFKDALRQLHLDSNFDTFNDRFAIKNRFLKTLKRNNYRGSSEYKHTTDIYDLLKKPHVKSFFESLKERYEEASKNLTENKSVTIDLDSIGVKVQARAKDSSQQKETTLDLESIAHQDEAIEKSISEEKEVTLDLDETETNDESVNNNNFQGKDITLDLENMEIDLERVNETTEDIGETINENAPEEENNEIFVVDNESGTKETEPESLANESEIQIEVDTEEPEIILEENSPESTFKYILDDRSNEQKEIHEENDADTLSILDKRFSRRRFRSPRAWQHKLNSLKNVGNV